MKHVHALCEAYDRLEAELRREHTSARVKAALAVMRSRVEAARYWMEQTGEVQREMFDDTTPKGEVIRAPYSDSGNSLDAAAGTIKSGAANRARHWCLRMLKKSGDMGQTCDEVETFFEWKWPGKSWHSTVSARLNGLVGDGLAFVDGKRRTRSSRQAGVYRITKVGLEALARERKPK